MNEEKIYSEKADKLFWYFKRKGGILILSTMLEYRDRLEYYSRLKKLGKIQTKRYNEMKKHIDELEKEKEQSKK